MLLVKPLTQPELLQSSMYSISFIQSPDRVTNFHSLLEQIPNVFISVKQSNLILFNNMQENLFKLQTLSQCKTPGIYINISLQRLAMLIKRLYPTVACYIQQGVGFLFERGNDRVMRKTTTNTWQMYTNAYKGRKGKFEGNNDIFLLQ